MTEERKKHQQQQMGGQQKKLDPGQAAVLAVKKRKEREAAQLEATTNELADVVWYVPCQKCKGVALWFTRKPGPYLEDDDWFTTYKPVGAPWPTFKIHCQVCYASGQLTKVKVLKGPGTKKQVYRRTIATMPRTAYEALMAGDIDEYERLMAPDKPNHDRERELARGQKMPALKEAPSA